MATSDQIQDLTEKMAHERGRLIDRVLGIDEADATRVPLGKTGEDQWTVKEQLAHLCEMELSYDSWVRAALVEDNPYVGGVQAPPVAIPIERANARAADLGALLDALGIQVAIPIERANAHAVQDLVDVMAAERRDTLALIAALAPADFDRTATHPMFGTLTVLQWLRSFYRHDRMHADQIAGREPEYRPQYAGAEPNQRAARIAKVQREREGAH